MPSCKETKYLPYSASQMFDLVMDVEKYPHFLPWCLAAKIVNHLDKQHFEADLVISFKGFSEKYSSDVKASQLVDKFSIDVVAIDGPFKNLANRWQFRDISGGCEIEFFIDFEFKSIILGKIIGAVFEKATNKMIDAFENRAKQIYKN